MSIFTIPYTFKAGMVAIANEVNSNFQTIISYLNELQSKFTQNDNIISNLANNYANINGSYNEQFNVKDATLDTHAINKRQLEKYTSNMIMYISGLVITQDDNDTILVSEGQCYSNEVDGDREILELTSQVSHTITSIASNTTYNIFIASDGSATNIVSTTGTTPGSGYDYYRLLGKVKTDNNSHITSVESYSNTTGAVEKTFTESINTITKVDGVYKITSSTIGIPNDGSVYIVWVSGRISGTGSGATRTIKSDIFPETKFLELDHDAGRASYAANIVSIPVGSGSESYIQVSGSNCQVIGYMRA